MYMRHYTAQHDQAQLFLNSTYKRSMPQTDYLIIRQMPFCVKLYIGIISLEDNVQSPRSGSKSIPTFVYAQMQEAYAVQS